MKKKYIQEKIYGNPGQYLMIDEYGNLCAGVPDNANYPAILITVPKNCIGITVAFPINSKTVNVDELNFIRYVYGTVVKLSDTLYLSTVPNFGRWTIIASLDNSGNVVQTTKYLNVVQLKQYTLNITN